jgi:hypothetical protein
LGAAVATVVDAAGPKDIGLARSLGMRLRESDDGALVAHVSGNGQGWTTEIADGLGPGMADQIRLAALTGASSR